MKKYLSKIGKSISYGIHIIAEGMSTFNIYPIDKVKILSDEESWKKDGEAIKSDWKQVGNDLRKAMKSAEVELSKNQPTS